MRVKVRGRLGPVVRKDGEQPIRILNRIIEWNTEGLWYEADQCHAEIFVRERVRPSEQQGPHGRSGRKK